MPIPVWACCVSWRVWFGQPFTISSTQEANKKMLIWLWCAGRWAVEDRQDSVWLSQPASIFPPVHFVIDIKRTSRVFKYRLFQSQRVNLGQRGAQDIKLEMRTYAGDYISAWEIRAGIWICTWKYPLWLSGKQYLPSQNLSSVVQTDTNTPWRRECKLRAVEQKRIVGKVEKCGHSIRMGNSAEFTAPPLSTPWVNWMQFWIYCIFTKTSKNHFASWFWRL